MKMQDRIEQLSEELGATKTRLSEVRAWNDLVDDEALAISEIEAIVAKRLTRSGYAGNASRGQDQTNTGKLVRVFLFVAERHGVELVRHLPSPRMEFDGDAIV